MYLIKILKASIKHLWKGGDTFCRQYSTGGLNPRNYAVVDESDLPLCAMCDRKHKSYRGIKCN